MVRLGAPGRDAAGIDNAASLVVGLSGQPQRTRSLAPTRAVGSSIHERLAPSARDGAASRESFKVTSDGTSVPSLDVTRPLRGVDDLERLVEFVHATNPKNETDWLEWKEGVDLSAPAGRYAFARAILGFANRSPATARRHVGGLAFVVLGVTPGAATGQPSIDNAQLSQGIRAYLGTQGPAWSPWWGTFNGAEVLVVTVEAPNDGDRIHTLRRTFEKAEEGTVFVRHPGVTDRASAADIEMLSARLRSAPLTLEIEVAASPVCALDAGPKTIERWLDDELALLLKPLQEDEMHKMADQQRQRLPGLGSRFDQISKMADQAVQPLIGRLVSEDRSGEEYRSEVETYLAKARSALAGTAILVFLEGECCELVVEVTNANERNVAGVHLELTFGAEVTLEREDFGGGMPMGPRLWGPRREGGHLGGLPFVPGKAASFASVYAAPRAISDVDHTVEGQTITFRVGHLRPKGTYKSTPVPALVDPGAQVIAHWIATSTEVDGVFEGDLEVPVSEVHGIERYLPHR